LNLIQINNQIQSSCQAFLSITVFKRNILGVIKEKMKCGGYLLHPPVNTYHLKNKLKTTLCMAVCEIVNEQKFLHSILPEEQ